MVLSVEKKLFLAMAQAGHGAVQAWQLRNVELARYNCRDSPEWLLALLLVLLRPATGAGMRNIGCRGGGRIAPGEARERQAKGEEPHGAGFFSGDAMRWMYVEASRAGLHLYIERRIWLSASTPMWGHHVQSLPGPRDGE